MATVTPTQATATMPRLTKRVNGEGEKVLAAQSLGPDPQHLCKKLARAVTQAIPARPGTKTGGL